MNRLSHLMFWRIQQRWKAQADGLASSVNEGLKSVDSILSFLPITLFQAERWGRQDRYSRSEEHWLCCGIRKPKGQVGRYLSFEVQYHTVPDHPLERNCKQQNITLPILWTEFKISKYFPCVPVVQLPSVVWGGVPCYELGRILSKQDEHWVTLNFFVNSCNTGFQVWHLSAK